MFSSFSRIILTLIVGCTGFQASAQSSIRIGQWRTHLPYTKGIQVVDGNEKVYCLSDVSFFSVEKSDRSVQKYDKVNGLSDIKVSNIAFSKQYNTLVVTYSNSNIDLIKGNTIINISDLKRKSITGDKAIYNIFIQGKYAYLSTGFAVVVLDIDKEEISDSYLIGDLGAMIKINGLTADSTYFYAATDNGVKKARRDAANLANYQNWITVTGLPAGKINQVINFRNNIIADWNSSVIYLQDTGAWVNIATPQDTNSSFVHLDTINSYLAISEYNRNTYNGRINRLDSVLHFAQPITDALIRLPSQIVEDTTHITWIADVISGLIRDDHGSMGQITVNGPQSTGVSKMSFKGDNLWVATGGYSNQFSGVFSDNGFYKYNGSSWQNFNKYNTPGLENFTNVYAVLADPNSDKVYFGSVLDGMLIYNNGQSTTYTYHNSQLQDKIGDPGRTAITGFAIDDSSNVWISNFYTNAPFVRLSPDGITMQRFSPPFNITGGAAQMLIDDNGQIWSIVVAPNPGMLVYNPTTNLWKFLGTGAGSGGLPSTTVYCMAKDKDGAIWVGTDQGIAVFYSPGSVMNNPPSDAQQIIVTNGGFAGYLLSTEKVTAITIDGGNRKWVGTTNGLWLFSPDGTQQLAYYNVDNSPLLSNNIACIAINPNSGEMFVGTDNGIISFRTDATEATDDFDKQQVCVFPNPIKPEFNGLIALRCLGQNSEVKITDVRGNMVYQTTAVGGEATWNGYDYTGRKADTGVYMVFAVNKDGSKSYVTKLLFVK